MTKLRNFGIVGTIIASLLCFTPAVVILFSAVGLGWLSGYIDYILIPAILLFAGIAVYALVRGRPSPKT